MRPSLRLVALLALWGGVAAAQPASTPGGDVQNGKRLFLADGCYECHGTTGAGGLPAGPALAPNPLPLPAFVNQLRHPRRMPPYREPVISDAQIADIRAYLASVPAGPAAAQIPLLSR